MAPKQKRTVTTALSTLPPDVVAAAQAESAKVQLILSNARVNRLEVVATPASIAANAKIMKALHARAASVLLDRIKRKELITKDELIKRLGGNRRWVNSATKSGRLFSLQAPSGIEYFPAFFADGSYNRRTLCKLAHVLDGLPGASKYSFFVTKSASLQMSPLEAVARGKTTDVMECALGYAGV